MTEQHPITPPPELVQEWASESLATQSLCKRAAQWGADQELEACCRWVDKWIEEYADCGDALRDARRHQPPSPAEEALEAAQRFYAKGHEDCTDEEVRDDFDIIRRALERLQELEGQGDG